MDENKLIAEFMGYKLTVTETMVLPGRSYGVNLNRFEKSWDYLIPVVEKIKDMQYTIECQERVDKIDNVLTCELRIQNLYDTVVEFIKQYKD